MKKLLLALVAVLMLVGCSAKTAEEPAGTEESETVKLDGLELQFVPSKDADVIIAGTEEIRIWAGDSESGEINELLEVEMNEEGLYIEKTKEE